MAGILIGLVLVDTFLTGWMLRESIHQRTVVAKLADTVVDLTDELASVAHDVDRLTENA